MTKNVISKALFFHYYFTINRMSCRQIFEFDSSLQFVRGVRVDLLLTRAKLKMWPCFDCKTDGFMENMSKIAIFGYRRPFLDHIIY